MGGLIQHFDTGQIHDTEVVGLMPVKALTGDQQDLLFPQQVKGELLIIGDVETLGVDLGEDIEAGLGLHSADTGDVIKGLGDKLSLLIYTSAGNDVVLDALIAAQRSTAADRRPGKRASADDLLR